MNLKFLREARGLSQYRLAKDSGVSQADIWRIENDKQKPGIETLRRLAVALGVTLDELASKNAS